MALLTVHEALMDAWRTFKGDKWKKEIDVRDFILNNVTVYTGMNRFYKVRRKRRKSFGNK
ncbi:PFL-like enzyme TdcE [Anoxybacillus sp. BCO1]|nr:PFL-like enzyme TdcE [Anoxybacillus sp. BCO1]